MAPYASLLAMPASAFVGFLQLSGFWLLPLSALAVYGTKYYHSQKLETGRAIAWQFVITFFCLSIVEWLGRIASLYMTGYSFFGEVSR